MENIKINKALTRVVLQEFNSDNVRQFVLRARTAESFLVDARNVWTIPLVALAPRPDSSLHWLFSKSVILKRYCFYLI